MLALWSKLIKFDNYFAFAEMKASGRVFCACSAFGRTEISMRTISVKNCILPQVSWSLWCSYLLKLLGFFCKKETSELEPFVHKKHLPVSTFCSKSAFPQQQKTCLTMKGIYKEWLSNWCAANVNKSNKNFIVHQVYKWKSMSVMNYFLKLKECYSVVQCAIGRTGPGRA